MDHSDVPICGMEGEGGVALPQAETGGGAKVMVNRSEATNVETYNKSECMNKTETNQGGKSEMEVKEKEGRERDEEDMRDDEEEDDLEDDDESMEDGEGDREEENGKGKKEDKDDDDEKVESLSNEERVVRGISCKDYGNEVFKKGEILEARNKYIEGLKFVKDLNESVEGASDIQKSLYLNVAMAHIRLAEWFSAKEAADKAIKLDPTNVKALYRRGYSRSQFGLLDEAKADLLEVLKLDSSNNDAKRELVNVKQRLQTAREQNRKSFGGLFNKTAGSLYEDREKEMLAKKQKEEEERQKRREIWHKEMDERQGRGEDEIAFDKWEEEYKKKVDEDNNAQKQKEEEEKRRRQDEERRAKEQERKEKAKADGKDGKEDDMDEEDQQIISETKKMGYCYFRREMTEEEKRLNAMNRPQRLEQQMSCRAEISTSPSSSSLLTSDPSPSTDALDASNSTSLSSAPTAASTLDAAAPKALSSWNVGGTTYEEKDVTAWAKEQFEKRLKETSVSNEKENAFSDPLKLMDLLKKVAPESYESSGKDKTMEAISQLTSELYKVSIKTKKVENLSGEANVAVLRGTRRFLFDFHCTVAFECRIDTTPPMDIPGMPGALDSSVENKEKEKIFSYNGELVLKDVTSTAKGREWLNDSSVKFSKSIREEHRHAIDCHMEKFKDKIVNSIELFMQDYSTSV